MFSKFAPVRVLVAGLLVLFSLTFAVLKSGSSSHEQPAESPALVPIIAATKSVAVVTGNADADADPGETLEYTVTINNTGPDPATGVSLNDTLQNITTLVGGSTIASPIAANDSYASVGNVGISVPDGASDLLGNDFDANNPGVNTALVFTLINATPFVSGSPVATTNGTVTANSNGSFSYNPNPGFEGSDSFTYTLGNGTGLTNTGTVTITVTGLIWFVNNTSPACTTLAAGCGRLSNPFSTLAAFQALNNGTGSNPAANDNVFIFESSAGYSGGVTLLAGQKLIGQDATATLAAITGIAVPLFSNALPAMNSGNGTVTNLTGTTTLNTNTTLRGLSINSTTLTGINDPAGAITGVNTSEVIAATTTGTAVLLSDTGGTISLTSVSSNGAANGISLTNTTGSLTVVGDGTNTSVGGNGSGGTIANATGADGATTGNGVYLSNTQNVTLRRMTINGTNQNYAIRGITVSNFNLEYSTVAGTNGNQPLQDEGSVRFSELTGAAGVLNCNISGGLEDNIRIGNTSGTLNRITVNGTTIGANSTANGNDGITIETLNSANINATIQNSTFTASAGDLFQFNSNASSGATDDLIFNNNTLTNNHPLIATGGGGTSIFSNGQKNFTFHIEGNSFRDAVGHNVLLAKSTGASTYSGTFTNNTIGVAAVANSGSLEGSALKVQSVGLGTVTIAITNNQIRQYNNFGIELLTGGSAAASSGNYNATVTGNTVSNPGTNPATAAIAKNGIHVNGGTVPGDTYQWCVDIGGAGALENSIVGSGLDGVPPTGLGNIDFRLRQRQATTIRLAGYAGANNNDAAVIAYVQGRNAGTPSGLVSNTVPTGGGYVGGAACTQPSTIALPTDAEAANIIYGFDNKLTFVNAAYQSLFESGEWADASGNASVNERAIAAVPESTLLGSRVSAFNTLIDKLGEMISPTAHSQETKPAAPESGETVTKSLGSLPAGESMTVKFRATVDSGPYASGVNNITNSAAISGNFTTVNTNTTSIALDAAPDLVVTKTEGGGTTQPGVTLVYTLSYSNTTATNGQNAANVVLTETVPANTTFNAAASLPSVWSCADGSVGGTTCTLNVGAVNAGAAASTATFAVNVLAALPAGVIQVSNTSSIAENPNVNGTDRVPANNTGPDTTNIIGNWLGGTSTDWFTAANWSNGVIPPAGNNVSVPNVANQPIVTTADVTLNNMNLIGENVTINVGRTITVTGAVTLGANIVNGPGTLALGPTGTINRTTGQVESTLIKSFTGPGSFTYPVGTVGPQFSPLAVTVTAGSGDLAVRANAGTAPATTPLVDATTLDRYWSLTETGSLTIDLLFTYLQLDVDGNENIYRLLKVPGTGTAQGFPNGSPCPGTGSPCVDPGANTIRVNGVQVFSLWTAGEAAPTAADATVSGRVLNREGRGLAGSIVSIVDGDGNVSHAVTNPFGYYRFIDVRAGESYVVSVRDKRFEFASRVINVSDDVAEVNFTPQE